MPTRSISLTRTRQQTSRVMSEHQPNRKYSAYPSSRWRGTGDDEFDLRPGGPAQDNKARWRCRESVAGKIKALANLSAARSASMPDIRDKTGIPNLYVPLVRYFDRRERKRNDSQTDHRHRRGAGRSGDPEAFHRFQLNSTARAAGRRGPRCVSRRSRSHGWPISINGNSSTSVSPSPMRIYKGIDMEIAAKNGADKDQPTRHQPLRTPPQLSTAGANISDPSTRPTPQPCSTRSAGRRWRSGVLSGRYLLACRNAATRRRRARGLQAAPGSMISSAMPNQSAENGGPDG